MKVPAHVPRAIYIVGRLFVGSAFLSGFMAPLLGVLFVSRSAAGRRLSGVIFVVVLGASWTCLGALLIPKKGVEVGRRLAPVPFILMIEAGIAGFMGFSAPWSYLALILGVFGTLVTSFLILHRPPRT